VRIFRQRSVRVSLQNIYEPTLDAFVDRGDSQPSFLKLFFIGCAFLPYSIRFHILI